MDLRPDARLHHDQRELSYLTRRALLVLLAAGAGAAAQTDEDAGIDLLTDLASALSEGNAESFLGNFQKTTPDYEKIRAGVNALTSQFDITCSIDPLSRQTADHKLTLLTDFFLQLSSKELNGPLVRRRERVTMVLDLSGKKAKIVQFSPVSIVAPVGS